MHMSVPRLLCLSEGSSVADVDVVVQRVGRDGGNFDGNFEGNNEPTCDPGSGAPSAVSVGCGPPDPEWVSGRQVIGIIGPTPAAPAHDHDSPSGTLQPHDGGFLAPVPRDAAPRDAGPADGGSAGAETETEPMGSVGVGGGGTVPANPGGGGDSQGPRHPPTPAGGVDLRPQLRPRGRGPICGRI